MSIASLEAFLERVQGDPGLRKLLVSAPDAARVAAIARGAGFSVSERDLWDATAASPDDLSPDVAAADAPAEGPAAGDSKEPEAPAGAAMASEAPVGVLPDPWLEPEPIRRFVHQAQGDAALREALATAPDAPAVAAIAQEAGYPISAVDLWLASGTTPDELAASLRPAPEESALLDAAAADSSAEASAPQEFAPEGLAALAEEETAADDPSAADSAAESLIRQFLEQAEADAQLRQALASAPDAASVAAIARGAGHPITEFTLWLASDASFEEVHPHREPPSPELDPLTLFLRAVEVDPDLQIALASAPDAATVAAIARIAGFPLTAAYLWAASDASPQELELDRRLVEELVVEELVVEDRAWPSKSLSR